MEAPASPTCVIAIGGSAGAIRELVQIIGAAGRLDAPVCVAVHRSDGGDHRLADIVQRAGVLSASYARDGDPLRPRHVYVAPPDHHLELTASCVRVLFGPRENRARPSIDVLFRTAAAAFGTGAIAVLLSGALDDGTAGIAAVREAGGVAIVQDPGSALFPDMPSNAIQTAGADEILPPAEIGPALSGLSKTCVAGGEPMNGQSLEPDAERGAPRVGSPSNFSCPDCGGVLTLEDDGPRTYRCRVGHAYSPSTLLSAQSDVVEEALWAGLRALEEKADMLATMASDMEERGNRLAADVMYRRAHALKQPASILRELLAGGNATLDPGKTALAEADGARLER